MKRIYTAVQAAILVASGATAFGVGTYFFASEPPAAHWFEASNLYISDTVEGVSPSLAIDRLIKKQFRAAWLVTVEKYDPNRDSYYVFCSATGIMDYKPNNILPDPMNLDWWTWPTKCKLPEGKYQVDTTWTLYPVSYSPKELTITSNIFEVGKAS